MASHDLHFNVEGGGGGGGGAAPMQSGHFSNHDIPIQGEMDHLPDHSSSTNNNNNNNMDNNTNNSNDNSGIAAYVQNRLKESAHPTACIFHVVFKACALTLYIFGYWFVGNGSSNSQKQGDGQAHFITLTVASILLLAADFWVVKNVTGRLLVGLRWWNQVHDDDTKWIFECADDNRVVNKFDQSIFWTVLYATPVIWALLFITGLLKFQVNWLLIVCIALCLSGSNVYGYYKCSKDQNVKFQQMMATTAQQGAMHVMRTNMLSVLTGTSAQTATNSGGNTYV
jgi:hypothetical protein